jgi:predicted nucleic acid-binding protein
MLALLDKGDPWHGPCSRALSGCALPLITTAAVLTEMFQFLVGDARSLASGWRFVRSGILTVMAITDADIPELERLMLKYADRTMDFADATLVRVADREGLSTILTVDRDFEVYRIKGRKAFRVVPKR